MKIYKNNFNPKFSFGLSDAGKTANTGKSDSSRLFNILFWRFSSLFPFSILSRFFIILFLICISAVFYQCGDGGGSSSGNVDNKDTSGSKAYTNTAYIKAINNAGGYHFGENISLSRDGNTLAVIARQEDNVSNKVVNNGGDITKDATADIVGAVYVYKNTGGKWVYRSYIKAPNAGSGNEFGNSVSLSADGSTLAVGAYNEDNASNKIVNNGGDIAEDTTTDSVGAAYVYKNTSDEWTYQSYIKAPNAGSGDYFGSSVSLSADGSTLAVGAVGEDNSSDRIVNNGANITEDTTANNVYDAGAVYIYTRNNNGVWAYRSYIKAPNAGGGDFFSVSVSLSEDGNTLAVGAFEEDNASNKVVNNGGSITEDATADNAGAVYVYARDNNGAWAYRSYIKAPNAGADDLFGGKVNLSGDGNTLVVGARLEDNTSNKVVDNGGKITEDGTSDDAGAVYVYKNTGGEWVYQSYIKAPNADKGDEFGVRTCLNRDGSVLAVGAFEEDNASNKVVNNGGGITEDATADGTGAVYVYKNTGGKWVYQSYIKAPNAGTEDRFGVSVGLSADGNTLAAGAFGEKSNAKGVGGDQSNNSIHNSGAVYIYSTQ